MLPGSKPVQEAQFYKASRSYTIILYSTLPFRPSFSISLFGEKVRRKVSKAHCVQTSLHAAAVRCASYHPKQEKKRSSLF
jgi:hypothetical protein